MWLRTFVIVLLIAIFASLASALVLLFRKRGHESSMVRALTWRIALSVTLFLLLMAGYYFGIIPQHGF